MKCLQTGMKREAVQEERSRGKGGGESNAGGGSNNNTIELNNKPVNVKDDQPQSTCTNSDMPLERILEAQIKSEKAGEDPIKHQSFRQEFNAAGGDPNSSIFAQIVEFAKILPLFPDLTMETQITLIKSGWNELMILGSAYRSMSLNEDGILMGQGKIITMEDAHRAGLGDIFDRVLVELVGKMEEMKMVLFLSSISCLLIETFYFFFFRKNARLLVYELLFFSILMLRDYLVRFPTKLKHCEKKCMPA